MKIINKGEIIMNCLNCNKPLIKGQKKYCSNTCQREYQYKQYIEQWKKGEFDGMCGQFGTSAHIKHYLIERANNQCEKCGWHEINPFTNKIPLELHHKDGDYRNNNEDNLELLCPNCHSLTETYRGGNFNKSTREGREKYVSRKNYCVDCGVEIQSTSTRCHSCEGKHRKVDKPVSREELKQLIRTMPFTKIGEKFGITDNAIRKWCDSYNLPRKSSEIKKYTDEEWELI